MIKLSWNTQEDKLKKKKKKNLKKKAIVIIKKILYDAWE